MTGRSGSGFRGTERKVFYIEKSGSTGIRGRMRGKVPSIGNEERKEAIGRRHGPTPQGKKEGRGGEEKEDLPRSIARQISSLDKMGNQSLSWDKGKKNP